MAKVFSCNVCGKQMNARERYGCVSIEETLGYESEFDGDHIEIDFCPKCFDDLIKKLVIPPFCKD